MKTIAKRPLAIGEAVLQYGDGEYRVRTPGEFVICAVTGEQIPIKCLRYWSVALQEAYSSPTANIQRLTSRSNSTHN